MGETLSPRGASLWRASAREPRAAGAWNARRLSSITRSASGFYRAFGLSEKSHLPLFSPRYLGETTPAPRDRPAGGARAPFLTEWARLAGTFGL